MSITRWTGVTALAVHVFRTSGCLPSAAPAVGLCPSPLRTWRIGYSTIPHYRIYSAPPQKTPLKYILTYIITKHILYLRSASDYMTSLRTRRDQIIKYRTRESPSSGTCYTTTSKEEFSLSHLVSGRRAGSLFSRMMYDIVLSPIAIYTTRGVDGDTAVYYVGTFTQVYIYRVSRLDLKNSTTFAIINLFLTFFFVLSKTIWKRNF